MKPILLAYPGYEKLAGTLGSRLELADVMPTLRRFPDGESYVRIEAPVAGREVILVCGLEQPDSKLLPLMFLAATARELGATSVGLVAPYLAYMRQDRRFVDGEGVTSRYFARLLSGSVDWLATVDPHLHRYHALEEIYSIPTRVVHAAPFISAWIRAYVAEPVLIGPDSESAQWVAAVAARASAPHLVLEKIRRGERDVSVSVPDIERWRGRTPVLVDDIISTARTMIETVGHLRRLGMAPPVCIGVHGILAGNAYSDLLAAGAARVITCNTVPHMSNIIDVTEPLAAAIAEVSIGIHRERI